MDLTSRSWTTATPAPTSGTRSRSTSSAEIPYSPVERRAERRFSADGRSTASPSSSRARRSRSTAPWRIRAATSTPTASTTTACNLPPNGTDLGSPCSGRLVQRRRSTRRTSPTRRLARSPISSATRSADRDSRISICRCSRTSPFPASSGTRTSTVQIRLEAFNAVQLGELEQSADGDEQRQLRQSHDRAGRCRRALGGRIPGGPARGQVPVLSLAVPVFSLAGRPRRPAILLREFMRRHAFGLCTIVLIALLSVSGRAPEQGHT